MKQSDNNKTEKVVSLAKRRGFIYQGSEIYGGLAGSWDYGPLGLELKNNIKNIWWKMFVSDRTDMYGVDAAILMNKDVWEASGHVSGFSDPMVECKECKGRFRQDQLEENKCPECGGELTEARQFNMMFETKVGATEDSGSVSYLRPETAQGMFTNFKNIIDSFHPKLPFGLAQTGKAFRNEISPSDFLFRTREFEQMEIEYFVKEEEWEEKFEEWRSDVWKYLETLGLSKENTHELEVEKDELAHYSKRTIDFEFDYPFGRKELLGLAYRTDYDLRKHMEKSGVSLEISDEDGKTFVPHVIEPSFGVDRLVFAILSSAYTEDTMGEGDRVYLKLKPEIAPIKVAVFPLLKNKEELQKKAREVFEILKPKIGGVSFDDNGNVGKRYRRQDEIGTPYCVTIDFDTLENNTVTVRDRDTGEQRRVEIENLLEEIKF